MRDIEALKPFCLSNYKDVVATNEMGEKLQVEKFSGMIRNLVIAMLSLTYLLDK